MLQYAKVILGLCAPLFADAGESLHEHSDVFTRCPLIPSQEVPQGETVKFSSQHPTTTSPRVGHDDETALDDNWAGIPLPNSVRFSSISRPAERLRDI